MQITLLELEQLIKAGYTPKINTPTGYELITDVYRKSGDGFLIEFTDGTNIKAADHHQVYNNKWVCCKDLTIGDDIGYNDVIKIVSNITKIKFQEWIDFTIDAEHQSYIHNGIQHHNSGKSLSIYLIMRYLNQQGLNGIVIVPNLSLIHQLYSDFEDYSKLNKWDVEDNIHMIYSGKEKYSDKLIKISTWQSLQNIKDETWFHDIDYVIVDESHGVKSTQLTKILESCINASYRFGLTGSLDNIQGNINTIVGLTGPVNKLITTKELIDRKQVTNLEIKCLVLKYDKETCKVMSKSKYQDEIKFLIGNDRRNAFIKNLALSTKNNTLILFNYVDSHGKRLYEAIKASKHIGDRNVYFIHGGVDAEERERIRNIVEKEQSSIIVASVGTMSTGVSIKNLHNIIFASPSKSRIRNLQSIGRVLRLNENKDKAVLYDIADNLSSGKKINHTLRHFTERVKLYDSEEFEYKITNINFEE